MHAIVSPDRFKDIHTIPIAVSISGNFGESCMQGNFFTYQIISNSSMAALYNLVIAENSRWRSYHVLACILIYQHFGHSDRSYYYEILMVRIYLIYYFLHDARQKYMIQSACI